MAFHSDIDPLRCVVNSRILWEPRDLLRSGFGPSFVSKMEGAWRDSIDFCLPARMAGRWSMIH